MRIVLDTNVLVSGLLSPNGPPGRILDLVLAGKVNVVFDDRIIAEYRDVLARPKLRISRREAEYVIDRIEDEGVLTPAPPLSLKLPDPKDQPFVEVAVAGAAEVLVTGNQRHFTVGDEPLPVTVLTPADFLNLWLSRGT
ncbi:MAG TPA: putative toxin-antitoxin system toxin component, PIN family [Longimicrobium sp.]